MVVLANNGYKRFYGISRKSCVISTKIHFFFKKLLSSCNIFQFKTSSI